MDRRSLPNLLGGIVAIHIGAKGGVPAANEGRAPERQSNRENSHEQRGLSRFAQRKADRFARCPQRPNVYSCEYAAESCFFTWLTHAGGWRSGTNLNAVKMRFWLVGTLDDYDGDIVPKVVP